ncbi:MAG TPA: hypothetical protein VMT74_04810 [Gaiellaceae bacterium]|nr:hypothetical protein [Gaiellaceae bacterium]
MFGTKGRLVAALAAALVLAPAAHAGGPGMVIGATEDAVRAPTLVQAKAQMTLLALAGFRGVRITEIWKPGATQVSATEKTILQNVAAAAKLDGIQVITSVMNYGSATTPLTDQDQSDFAAYAASVVKAVPALRAIIVGNEPNLNRYWLPQFNPDGTDAAAPAYESLLAQTYDAVKAADPGVEVLGGAVSPRGSDNPALTGRPTHSPTGFIRDLGAAYRASGRTTPIMDAFAFHPYEDDSSVAPFLGTHPNSTTIALADYPKLVALLGQAFDGTAQPGSTLPIVYDEFGVESQIPPAKQSLYTGTEPATTKPVSEQVQADYYRQAIQLAFCQPNVQGLFLFHAFDETALAAWQSGLYYADDTPKSSLPAVRASMEQSHRGVVARCNGMRLAVHPKVVQSGTAITLTCDLDCAYVAELYRLPGKLLATARGTAIGGRATALRLRVPSAAASYRLRLSAVAPVNRGPTAVKLVPLRPG